MAAVTNELARLIRELPEEDSEWLIRQVRKRTEQRSVPMATVLSGEDKVPLEESVTAPSEVAGWLLRWPQLGPAAIGAALLLGWGAGIAAGPFVAIFGAVLGLVLGDRLDRRSAVAADA